MNNNTEVFGNTFKDYNKEEMEGFIYPFKARFALNGIDYKEVFKDKYCLDAGCGSGRGSLFMAQGEAKHITALDISDTNLETTKSNMFNFGFKDMLWQKRASLLDIPYDNNTFDVVWCNGVAHHTGDTGKAISELVRVLKPGGNLWLYIYGGGGIFWSMIFKLRQWVQELEPAYAIKVLRDNKFKTPEIGQMIDHLFCEYLHTYNYIDVYYYLLDLGLMNTFRLSKGMIYDTSMRKGLFPGKQVFEEDKLMGKGDLRFWCKKVKTRHNTKKLKKTDNDNFLPNFIPSCDHKDWNKVIYSGHIIRYMMKEMNKLIPFDVEKFTDYLNSLSIDWEIKNEHTG